MAAALRRFLSMGLHNLGPTSSHLLRASSVIPGSIVPAMNFSLLCPARAHVRTAASPGISGESDSTSAESAAAPERVKRVNTAMPVGATTPIDVTNLERMEKSINQVTLMGRVGSDPQLRGTEENPVLLFSLATHENYRDEEGRIQQKTMWHRVGIFKAGLRETVFKYLKKGMRLHVQGMISYGNVKDQETNLVRVVTTVIADEVIVLAGPSLNSAKGNY